jgi:hypothetical protein
MIGRKDPGFVDDINMFLVCYAATALRWHLQQYAETGAIGDEQAMQAQLIRRMLKINWLVVSDLPRLAWYEYHTRSWDINLKANGNETVAKQILRHIRTTIREKSKLKKSVVPLPVKEPILDPNPHLVTRFLMLAKSASREMSHQEGGDYDEYDDEENIDFIHSDHILPRMPPASPAPRISWEVVPNTPTGILPADVLTDSLLETFPLPEMSQTEPDTAPESEVVPDTARERAAVPDTAHERAAVPAIASDADTQSPLPQPKRHRVGEVTRGRGKRVRKTN